jgi:hypothetical protein
MPSTINPPVLYIYPKITTKQKDKNSSTLPLQMQVLFPWKQLMMHGKKMMVNIEY